MVHLKRMLPRFMKSCVATERGGRVLIISSSMTNADVFGAEISRKRINSSALLVISAVDIWGTNHSFVEMFMPVLMVFMLVVFMPVLMVLMPVLMPFIPVLMVLMPVLMIRMPILGMRIPVLNGGFYSVDRLNAPLTFLI